MSSVAHVPGRAHARLAQLTALAHGDADAPRRLQEQPARVLQALGIGDGDSRPIVVFEPVPGSRMLRTKRPLDALDAAWAAEVRALVALPLDDPQWHEAARQAPSRSWRALVVGLDPLAGTWWRFEDAFDRYLRLFDLHAEDERPEALLGDPRGVWLNPRVELEGGGDRRRFHLGGRVLECRSPHVSAVLDAVERSALPLADAGSMCALARLASYGVLGRASAVPDTPASAGCGISARVRERALRRVTLGIVALGAAARARAAALRGVLEQEGVDVGPDALAGPPWCVVVSPSVDREALLDLASEFVRHRAAWLLLREGPAGRLEVAESTGDAPCLACGALRAVGVASAPEAILRWLCRPYAAVPGAPRPHDPLRAMWTQNACCPACARPYLETHVVSTTTLRPERIHSQLGTYVAVDEVAEAARLVRAKRGRDLLAHARPSALTPATDVRVGPAQREGALWTRTLSVEEAGVRQTLTRVVATTVERSNVRCYHRANEQLGAYWRVRGIAHAWRSVLPRLEGALRGNALPMRDAFTNAVWLARPADRLARAFSARRPDLPVKARMKTMDALTRSLAQTLCRTTCEQASRGALPTRTVDVATGTLETLASMVAGRVELLRCGVGGPVACVCARVTRADGTSGRFDACAAHPLGAAQRALRNALEAGERTAGLPVAGAIEEDAFEWALAAPVQWPHMLEWARSMGARLVLMVDLSRPEIRIRTHAAVPVGGPFSALAAYTLERLQ